jgi:hypothetical protein
MCSLSLRNKGLALGFRGHPAALAYACAALFSDTSPINGGAFLGRN